MAEVEQNQAQPKKVVIVGAGMAGLAAAHKLTNTNSEHVTFDVKLLEAKAYPGGRTHSVRSLDGKFSTELGAYVLYYYRNPSSLNKFVERKKLGSEKSTDGSHNELDTESGPPNIHLLSNGVKIEPASAKYYEKIYFDILEEIWECGDQNDWTYTIRKEWPKNQKCCHPDQLSLGEYIEIRFFEAVEASPPKPLPAGCTPRHIFNRMMSFEYFNTGSTEFNQLELVPYGEYHDPDGSYTDNVCFSDIVSAIQEELPSDVLQCSSVVSSVTWTATSEGGDAEKKASPVLVQCENGQAFEADHVILTPSLGVLKEWTKKQTITPSLPTKKLESIAKLGMGVGTSVHFEFPAPILEQEHEVIELFWLEEDCQDLTRYPWIQSLDAVIRRIDSNFYGIWLTGESARLADRASDSELIDGICALLENFLKKPVPRPIRVISDRWTTDPYTLGSYSYYPKGSYKKDRIALFEPVSGSTPLQLLFAGEATHPMVYSSTNGAFETGQREANRLLKHYSKAN